jgi:hypothetical protein
MEETRDCVEIGPVSIAQNARPPLRGWRKRERSR